MKYIRSQDSMPRMVKANALPQTVLCVGMVLLPCFLAVASSLSYGQISADLDSDGVPDVIDVDQDNDGIVNSLEGVVRFEELSASPAQYFAVTPVNHTRRASSIRYDLTSLDNGQKAMLTGTVLSSDTEVEWSMHDALPKLRNLSSGVSVVQWEIAGQGPISNIDLTISDLDGLRSETVAVSDGSVIGYSLALNSNVQVSRNNSQLIFTGTGQGGESVNDLVTLHFRGASTITLGYSNGISADANSVVVESEVAGYRHSLEAQTSTYFTPVTRYRDTDGDGVADHRDLDSDNDGLGDVIESGGLDADNNNLSDGPVDEHGLSINAVADLSDNALFSVTVADNTVHGDDADGDGLLSSVDGMLEEFGGSLSGKDQDGDGLDDLNEVRIHMTNPVLADTDEDGLDDGAEITHYNTSALHDDTDLDGLTDSKEVNQYGTDPTQDDSDADGVTDGVEIQNATDPLVSDRIIIVMPDPEPTIAASVDDENARLTAVNLPDSLEVTANPDVELEDADIDSGTPGTESDALLLDDESQINQPTLNTGLNGMVGCSVVNTDESSVSFLLCMILVLAIFGLTNRTKSLSENE